MTRWRQRRRELAPLALLLLLTTACTRMVDSPRALPQREVAPISTQQVTNLLSSKVTGVEGNQFDEVDPDRCTPVAREVSPPLLTDRHPAAIISGHWQTEDGGVVVEEIVAVYPSDFDPSAALADAHEAVESCAGTSMTVTTVHGRSYGFDAEPTPSSPAGAVLWSLRGAAWSCDNAMVAAHNAAIEITTCGAGGGLDTAALATDALARIEALANAKV
ncbi:MAG: sensor domain-containing protein [Mycobacterium sp.]